MRWYILTLQKQDAEAGTDKLGNPIKTPKKLADARGRLSNWTAADISIEERTVTETSRKILTPAALVLCQQADTCILEGTTYEITEVRDTGKWRMLIAKAYRTKAVGT